MKERIASATMNVLRFMCVALLVGAISSCGGKKNEPTPPSPTPTPTPAPAPTPTPNPGGGTEDTKEAGIKIKIKDGAQLSVRLDAGSAKLKGEELKVKETKTIKVTKGDIVTITGAPEGLTIGNAQIEYIAIAENASGVASSLKELNSYYSEASKGYLESINLVGATNLESLTLRDYGDKFTKLDLSKLGKLKKLSLGRDARDDAQRSLAEVVWPTNNVIEELDLRETGIKANIPFGSFEQLKSLKIIGTAYGALNQDVVFDGHPHIEKVYIRLMHHVKNLTLKDCPNLSGVTFTGNRNDDKAMSGDVAVTITGNKALVGKNVILAGPRSGESATPHIVEINISNNNLSDISLQYTPLLFSGAGVKKVDISSNRLSEANIIAIISALPQGDGSQVFIGAKASGEENKFTEAHKKALAAKRWTVK